MLYFFSSYCNFGDFADFFFNYYMNQGLCRMCFTCMMCLPEFHWPGCAIQLLELGHLMVNLFEILFALLGLVFPWIYDVIGFLKSGAERPDITSQFTSILYQLLLDPSERVCFEAILCVLGRTDTTERCVFSPIYFSFSFI